MSKTKAKSYAAQTATSALAPFEIHRREPGPSDVEMEILFCGVCHSDLHQARDEWHNTVYPCVPGHEIVGRVTRVGSRVTKFTVGDVTGVGCMVDSCRTCENCRAGNEQYCLSFPVFTYNGEDAVLGGRTYGGYSTSIVVDEAFVLRIPAGLDLAAAAPLLCAGITTYSPLKQWGCKPGDRVGVVGLGGLGHMAVKLAVAMGAEVTVFSTSRAKEADARRMGATDFVETRDPAVFASLARRFDLVIDTVSAAHDYNLYLATLRPHGAMVVVGAPPAPTPVSAFALIMGNRRLAGSLIGGIRETQEMLDFCGAHRIGSDVEVIPIQQINAAYERLLKGDVRYRFVIDLASLKA